MANRRVISKDIYNQRNFLRLSSSCRDLYTYLVLNSDIDGIVEAFSVMRIINASEADLMLLNTLQYIKILNNDWVTYIMNFTSFNNLDGRDAKGSIYRDLLIKVIPDVNLVALKKRPKKKLPKELPCNSHGNTTANSTKLNTTQFNNSFNQFQQNEYNFSEIEKKLLQN